MKHLPTLKSEILHREVCWKQTCKFRNQKATKSFPAIIRLTIYLEALSPRISILTMNLTAHRTARSPAPSTGVVLMHTERVRHSNSCSACRLCHVLHTTGHRLLHNHILLPQRLLSLAQVSECQNITHHPRRVGLCALGSSYSIYIFSHRCHTCT